MSMRVTDLEQFALEQIWRPYQTLAGYSYRERLASLPMTLDETAEKLREPSIWRDHVMGRIRDIDVTFPPYISHPLVDVVRGFAAKG